MRRALLTGALLLASSIPAQAQGDACPAEIVITAPSCGQNFIDQPAITVKGFVRAASGTVLVSVSSRLEPYAVTATNGTGACPESTFEVTVPLNCGCTHISAVLDGNPLILSRTIHVHQGPPLAFVKLPGRFVRIGGCNEFDEIACTGLLCPGWQIETGDGVSVPAGATRRCEGGSATCFTTPVVDMAGSVPTANSTMTIAGPFNSVEAVVEDTLSRSDGSTLIHRFTAPGLQLASGTNSVTFRTQTGSVVNTRVETLCVDLFAPPRVCLTFLEPPLSSFVATAATTVVGSVAPREASVRLRHGASSHGLSPDSTGAFRLPVTLNQGLNTLRLEAELATTVVSIEHSV